MFPKMLGSTCFCCIGALKYKGAPKRLLNSIYVLLGSRGARMYRDPNAKTRTINLTMPKCIAAPKC